jgi:hypothetical protein
VDFSCFGYHPDLESRLTLQEKWVLGQAIRETYADIFLIKEHPTASDKTAVEGKFKSYHNASENVAGLMTKTFYGLLPLADLSANSHDKPKLEPPVKQPEETADTRENSGSKNGVDRSFHYNIQIHLPATKDAEVYNAIFKSLKDHLLD